MTKSCILIVTICSNRKMQGGDRSYDRRTSLCSLLPPRHARDLIQRRQQIFDLLCGDEVSRDGLLLRNLPYNVGLTDGPDLGGSASACYLPAVHRYRGRFYSELGTGGIQLMLKSPQHHLLIVSGLYGLLTAEERIQAYSCQADLLAQTRESLATAKSLHGQGYPGLLLHERILR